MCYIPDVLYRADDLRGSYFEEERGGLMDVWLGVGPDLPLA